MDQEYRYPLTRHCLRHGALTLPRTMLGLFPEDGAVTAVDTRSDVEFEIVVTGPRTVAGLDEFFAAHELDVNDELLIRPLEDGRFAFTPLPRVRKPDYARPGAVATLLDELAEAELAASEVEVRALYPDLPADFDLKSLLEADDRFVFFEGRWHARAALERRIDEEESLQRARRTGAQAAGRKAQDPAATPMGVAVPRPVAREAASGPPAAEDRPESQAPGGARQEALWQSTWQDPWQTGAPTPWREPEAAPEASDPGPGSAPERERTPAPPDPEASDERGASPAVRERRAPPRAPTVFPGDAALAHGEEDDEEIDLQTVGQARELLQAFGFRVEALGQGQLMVHAELGRRGYTALVFALGYGQRLDWAALLARRRESGARYLAVFGDRRDLQRLQAPAELARATLWSWEGLHRVRT